MNLLDLRNSDNELVVIDGKLFQLKIEYISADNFNHDLIAFLKRQLAEDSDAQEGLIKMHRTAEDWEQFGICRYGGFDNKPDFNIDSGETTHDFYDCPLRGSCPGEGLVCKSIICGIDEVTGDTIIINAAEIRVLKLMSQDLTDIMIADKLDISEHTVRKHLANLRLKLNMHSKQALTRWAMERGIA